MEFVEGKPLSDLIPSRGMSLRDVLKIGIQVADALSCAHAARIIHRDIKPSNIMVRDGGLVKVLDFGLAKLVEGPASAEVESTRSVALTQEGVVLGTLNYMAPEQLESGKVDERSDIFSFGVVLFEMLTGQKAFRREYRFSAVSAILRDEPKWPEERSSALPAELGRIVNRCLRKDPERRYQSIQDVKNALEEIWKESQSTGAGARMLSVVRRNPLSVIATIVVLLGLAGLAVWRVAQPGPEQLSLSCAPLPTTKGLLDFPRSLRTASWWPFIESRWGRRPEHLGTATGAGVRPIRLTRDPADELTPTFSPDGSQIAFSSIKDGGGLYVMPALGGEQRLVARGRGFGSPTFSPDGKSLALAPNAVVIPVLGGAPRRLAEGFTLLWSPVWSPDGKHVLFAGDVREAESDWYVVPSDGGPPVGLGFHKLGAAPSGPREWIGKSYSVLRR